MKVFVNWQTISVEEDFYQQFLPQLNAPAWHGHNLDALNDSIVIGDINGIEPPFCVINTGVKEIKPELVNFHRKVIAVLKSAKTNGRNVRLFEE